MLHRLSQVITAVFLGAALLFVAPAPTLAQSSILDDATSALDQAGATTYGDAASYEARPGLMSTIGNIVRIVLGLLGILFIILIIYAGVLWMTSAGNSDQVEKARGIIVQAVIGLVVIMAAYIITATVFQVFGGATGTTFSGVDTTGSVNPNGGAAGAGAAGVFN